MILNKKIKIRLDISDINKNYCIQNLKAMQIDTPKNCIMKLQNLVSSENKSKNANINQKSAKPRFKIFKQVRGS